MWKQVLKFGIAGGLLYWLLESGKLDFSLLTTVLHYPLNLSLSILLSLINLLIISWRWRVILTARTQVSLPLFGLLKINWIGQFFSSVLPGSVSGDLVKIFYVQRYDQTLSKKFLLVSIFIDRLMGLFGLIFLVGLCSLIFGAHVLDQAPGLEPLLKFNSTLVVLTLLSLGIFFFYPMLISKIFIKAEEFLPGKAITAKFKQLWEDLTAIKAQIIKTVLVSIVVQTIGVVSFWLLINPLIPEGFSLIEALCFIPLGFMTLALPIAPSGLGVGHMIFQKLFELSDIHQGASLFNAYFVVTLTVNLIGMIPYLSQKMKR